MQRAPDREAMPQVLLANCSILQANFGINSGTHLSLFPETLTSDPELNTLSWKLHSHCYVYGSTTSFPIYSFLRATKRKVHRHAPNLKTFDRPNSH